MIFFGYSKSKYIKLDQVYRKNNKYLRYQVSFVRYNMKCVFINFFGVIDVTTFLYKFINHTYDDLSYNN